MKIDDLTVPLLEKWIGHFKNDPVVKEDAQAFDKLHDDVFVKMHIEHIDFSKDIPEKFTKEMYINTFNKIWATIRHDMWKEI